MLYTDRKGNKYSILPMEDTDRSELENIPGLGDDLMALKELMNESVPMKRTPACVLRESSYSGGSLPEGEKTARLLCAIPRVREVFFIHENASGKYIMVKPVEDMSDAGLREYSNEGVNTHSILSFPMLKKLKSGIAPTVF